MPESHQGYQCGHAGYRATVQGQYIHGEHFVGRHQPSVCQASTQDRQTNYVHVEEDSDPRDGARQEDDGEVADDVEDFGCSDEDEVVDRRTRSLLICNLAGTTVFCGERRDRGRLLRK